MIEIPLVIGYLTAYALTKARRAAKRLDSIADDVLDDGLDRLDSLIRSKVSPHPALQALDCEAAAIAGQSACGHGAMPEREVSDSTRRQLELCMSDAMAGDSGFAQQVARSLAGMTGEGVAKRGARGARSVSIKVSGNGSAFYAERDQHINTRS